MELSAEAEWTQSPISLESSSPAGRRSEEAEKKKVQTPRRHLRRRRRRRKRKKKRKKGGGATASRPTEALDELHEAHDVVGGGVGEHLDVVGADEGLEDVEDGSLGLSCVWEEGRRSSEGGA